MLSCKNTQDYKQIDVGHIQLSHNDKIIDVYYTDKYVYCESNDYNLNSLNIKLSNMDSVSVTELKDMISKTLDKITVFKPFKYDDFMGLFDQNSVASKYEHNKSILLQVQKDNYSTAVASCSKIPKELYISSIQRFNMIYQEIERLNRDMTNPYYIVCNDNNIYNLSIRFKYNGELGKLLNKNSKEYFELNFCLDDKLYPYVPPKVSYVQPNIDITLIYNIYDLDIWSYGNWNYTITLDKLVTNLGNELEKHFIKYYNKDINTSNLYNLILQFSQNINDIPFEHLDIKLDFSKLVSNSSSSNKKTKYWNSGVGYGTGKITSSWDINSYIKERDNSINKNNKLLKKINKEIQNSDDITIIYSSVLYTYLIKQLTSCNILEITKNKDLYNTIIDIVISLYNKSPTQDFINDIYKSISDLNEEINIVLVTSQEDIEENLLNMYIKVTSLFDTLKSKITVTTITEYKPTDDKVQNYIQMVENNKFKNFEFTDRHLYYIRKNNTINKKSIIRIVSELSSMKNNLPINWDTSIVFRTSKTNINFVSFMISGPKDTPYENGLFEFHAYFPDNYPLVVPHVLLKTTGNGSVRFNPNLYNCGKVCLSLLDTWRGDQGESWNPKLSTFLQVLISIQSLILVEQPYFNEPGWECQMHTEQGRQASFNYNDNIRLQTIRVAMVDMIKNTPDSYQDFVKEHFKLKKDEIFSTIEKWISESKKHKDKMVKYYEELKTLI